MSLYVLIQVIAPTEFLVTDVAIEWFFAHVKGPYVTFQMFLPFESSIAEFATKLFGSVRYG